MKIKNILNIILLFILLGITFGAEPIPPPFYKYSLSGYLQCDTLTSKSNYSILFYARKMDDSSFVLIDGISELGNQHPIDVTKQDGSFNLIINSYFLFDSVRVGLIDNNNVVVFSTALKIDENSLQQVLEDYVASNNSGCNSCSSNPTETRIKNYFYKADNINFNICQ